MKTAVPGNTYRSVLLSLLLLSIQTLAAQNIDFGKSYINVTKGLNGGTTEQGDTLEIRASIVVRAGTFDSCAYFDAIPSGTNYITGTIRVLTNEGKIYKQFTDAISDDEGWISGTNIRINLGYTPGASPASVTKRGRIISTHRPSFYGSTCIMIASFRVKVTAGYNSTISIGGGSMSYKPQSGSLTSFVFPGRTIAIYENVGICPNAVGANALGTEFNGTFGSGKPRNRGTSANVPVGYTYNTFTSGGPNDYYYGIPNNTSINTGYTTTNSWPKPDATHRVFGVWDVIGDHTGATNPQLGNTAADTVANPNAGYMLVINAAYRIDSAFQQTIGGLCPNTYYEISLWMRNICSRCGCDSAGRGAGNTGYIPTAAGDSSGVYPNLSFNVNGIDYYTTGNILYTGKWIKKGFTFLTGPGQTSFTLKVFNNAPGGGGNDWALDDISVATCSPNLTFTPNNNPSVCKGNTVDLGAYIRSYFNNYTYFKWQQSIDNGFSWTDAGSVNTGTPVWNGTAWEYFTSYPTFVATMADSGRRYRVVVASTSSNITNSSCSFADVASVLTLNVIDCGSPLSTDIVSFKAMLEADRVVLKWTSNKEQDVSEFVVEKSRDGREFSIAATIKVSNTGEELNHYTWSEGFTGGQLFYRIRLKGNDRQKISRTLRIATSMARIQISSIKNPFHGQLTTDLYSTSALQLQMTITDGFGRTVVRGAANVTEGTTPLKLEGSEHLPPGFYTLRIEAGSDIVIRKLIKQ